MPSYIYTNGDKWWVRCKHNNPVGPFDTCQLALQALRDIYAEIRS